MVAFASEYDSQRMDEISRPPATTSLPSSRHPGTMGPEGDGFTCLTSRYCGHGLDLNFARLAALLAEWTGHRSAAESAAHKDTLMMRNHGVTRAQGLWALKLASVDEMNACGALEARWNRRVGKISGPWAPRHRCQPSRRRRSATAGTQSCGYANQSSSATATPLRDPMWHWLRPR